MNDLITIKSIKNLSPASFKTKATTRNTALIFPNLKKGKVERNYISAWVDSSFKPLSTIEDYAEKTVAIQNCNDVVEPFTPNSYAHVFDEQFDHKLLPVLANSQVQNVNPYRNLKKIKFLSKDAPIYSSKTCLKVSEHSFEKIEVVKTQPKKKISL
jgi:hypothetical protein